MNLGNYRARHDNGWPLKKFGNLKLSILVPVALFPEGFLLCCCIWLQLPDRSRIRCRDERARRGRVADTPPPRSSSCIVNFVCDSGVPFVSMLLLALWVDCVLLVRMFCSFVFTISLCQQLWVQNNRYYRDDLLSWFLPWRAIELVHNCLGMSWFRLMESTTDVLSTVLVDGADCKLAWQSYRVETLVRKNVWSWNQI